MHLNKVQFFIAKLVGAQGLRPPLYFISTRIAVLRFTVKVMGQNILWAQALRPYLLIFKLVIESNSVHKFLQIFLKVSDVHILLEVIQGEIN